MNRREEQSENRDRFRDYGYRDQGDQRSRGYRNRDRDDHDRERDEQGRYVSRQEMDSEGREDTQRWYAGGTDRDNWSDRESYGYQQQPRDLENRSQRNSRGNDPYRRSETGASQGSQDMSWNRSDQDYNHQYGSTGSRQRNAQNLSGQYDAYAPQNQSGGRGSSQQTQRGYYAGVGPKNYSRSGDRIIEDVNQMLTDHHEIDASEIEVAFESGEVILRGKVESREAKRLAEDLAEKVPGVRDVRNELKVGSASKTTHSETTKGAGQNSKGKSDSSSSESSSRRENSN